MPCTPCPAVIGVAVNRLSRTRCAKPFRAASSFPGTA